MTMKKGRNEEMLAKNLSDRLISEISVESVTSAGPEPAEWVVQYSYDLVGNRTQMVDNDQTINYTLSANRLTSWGTSGQQQFDSAGNVTNIQYDDGRQLALKWDSQYQVTEVRTNGTLAESYQYDALGRRTAVSDGATINYLVYDGIHCIAETDSAGNLLKSYVYSAGIDNILSMTVYGGTTQTYYYVKDHLGSVLALTDSNGTVVESYRYDAWGNTTVFDGSGNPLTQSAIGNRFCWQGREISWATRLYYFRARWYDPVTGRWLSNDPIGISGGLNQYVFCDNNPVNFRDPFGLDNLNLLPPGTKEYKTADSAGIGIGEFTVAAHGNPSEITGPNGKPISVVDLADMIRKRPDYDSTKPVRLNACSTGGETDDGTDNFAQQLANALGNTVVAPTRPIDRLAWKSPFSGKYSYLGTIVEFGRFKSFLPKK